MTTCEELIELLTREFKVAPGIIEVDKPLAAYGLDSLSLVELMFTVEEHFEIDIPTEGTRFETLADLGHVIDQQLLKKAA